ncbi:MAG: hypothetical protein ABEJ68_07340 [Halobacteriaceae archaeon]
MFSDRDLPPDVAAVRAAHAPDAAILDSDGDFETLPPAARDELATRADALDPVTYDQSWLPPDAPELLARFAGSDLTIGMPGDGAVAWTTQTAPPTVIVKPRIEGSPEDFVDFLVAEALVEVGADVPEQFLGLFGAQYRDFADALDAAPGTTYQVAAAVCDAYRGLHTRPVFSEWGGDHDRLFAAWSDAGSRLQPRLDGLMRAVARGDTDFGDAAELACAGVKHGLDVPAPFDALDVDAFRDHGADYAVRWAEKVRD